MGTIYGAYRTTKRFERTFGIQIKGAMSRDAELIETLQQDTDRITIRPELIPTYIEADPMGDHEPRTRLKYQLNYVVDVK